MNTTPRLSTTSEGLWLAAAFGGVTQLPPVLKIRPVGSAEPTLADHPGMAALQYAGVVCGSVLDPDVAAWVGALGRPDIEVDMITTRPDHIATQGPPPLFNAPADHTEAAAALARWNAEQPPQRAAALCRRRDTWVGAARAWKPPEIDQVVIGPVDNDPAAVVRQVIRPVQPARFDGLSAETDALIPALTAWQANPRLDVVAELVHAGLTVTQGRIVAATCDAGSARTEISATQFDLNGPTRSPLAVTVADTPAGRVLVTHKLGPDGRRWTTLLPGTDAALDKAVGDLLETLPCGREWRTHRRDPQFAF